MKLFKRFDKRYNPMLWIGLAIWGCSFLGSWVLSWMGVEISAQENLMDMARTMYEQSPVFCLMVLCCICPFLEECSFRLWGRGKVWCVIVSLLLMMVFCAAELNSWIPVVVIVALGVAWFLLKEKKFLRTWVMAVASSVLFALCHLSGFSSFSLGAVLGLTEIFGFALVLSYLTVNLSFWFSVLLHILNNSVAILLPLLLFGETFEVNMDHCTLKASSIDPFSREVFQGKDFDTIADNDSVNQYHFSMEGQLSEVVCQFLNMGSLSYDTIYDHRLHPSMLDARYSVSVTYDSLCDFNELARLLIDDKDRGLKTDTIEEWVSSIWVDNGGSFVPIEQMPNPYELFLDISCSEESIGSFYMIENDSANVSSYWCVKRPSQLADAMSLYEQAGIPLNPDIPKVEYRKHHKITTIVVRYRED